MDFFYVFGIYIKLTMFSKTNEPHRSGISEVSDSEICGYLNL